MNTKKIISLVLVFLIAFSCVSAIPCVNAEEGRVLLGDVNLDGKVNIRDVTLVQKYLASLEELSERQLMAIDANGDKELNIKDATSLQKFIAGVEKSEIIGVEITEAETSEAAITEITKPSETAEPSETTEETWVELGTEPTETTGLPVIETEHPVSEHNTVPAETTEATESYDETLAEIEPTPDESSEATEATEATETTSTEPTETTKASEPQKDFSTEIDFGVLEVHRISRYADYETELYLVRNTEELLAVHSGVQDEYGDFLYEELELEKRFDSEYFAEKSLVVSFNCVGGGCSTQSIDSLSLKGDNLIVSRTLRQPETDTCDINYQYVLIEVDAEKVENVRGIVNKNTIKVIYNEEIFSSVYFETELIALYFTNTENWQEVYIYFWGEDYSYDWPGQAMDYVETNSLGQDIYMALIPGDCDGVVFNSGLDSPQTNDIYDDILDGYGFYPTTYDGMRWNTESYVYIVKTDIRFVVADECRVESYGSDNPEVYLVRSVAEYQAVLDTIGGSENAGFFEKPVAVAKYDDLYFMSDSLIISLSCVGGSNCFQEIANITREGNKIVLYRTVFQPEFVTPDMNYQFVLIEVDNSYLSGVTEITDNTKI